MSASSAGRARSTPSLARTGRARARSSASPAARSSPTSALSTIMGEPLTAADPLLARRLGLATVYQDDSLVRELTVARKSLCSARRNRWVAIAGRNEWAERAARAPTISPISPDALVGNAHPGRAAVPRDRQGARHRPEGAAPRRADLLPRPRRCRKAHRASSAASPPRARRSSMSAIGCRRFSALADRVTILRDGLGQGTYDVNSSLSENDLIALMVGRPIEVGYPAKRQADLEAAGVASGRRD